MRRKLISIALKENEYSALKEACDEQMISISEFIRWKAFDKIPIYNEPIKTDENKTEKIKLLSKKEVANLFRVESCTIDRWVKKGILKNPIKNGSTKQSKIFYRHEDVINVINQMKKQ